MLLIDILDKYLKLGINLLLISHFAHLAYPFESVRVDSLLYVFLCLLRSSVHLTDAFAVGLSSGHENFINHFLAHLGSKNFIDFLIMKECNLPVLVTEIFGKVFEIGSFVPFNIIECDELTLLLVLVLIDENASEN